ncbi:Pfam:DUF23 [Seminavis robusta]|uniref:Pfam:DUF23 n=1 Tax=Seminavis robusta TaxID=568900 RepID=A0A9N8EAX1_9STRA|nr:Pfam:DUF23 [Seminavis robusta]|eukprot:Sro859_g211960.1 Pfam:DUF23 (442) ;mRNA; r:15946-17271
MMKKMTTPLNPRGTSLRQRHEGPNKKNNDAYDGLEQRKLRRLPRFRMIYLVVILFLVTLGLSLSTVKSRLRMYYLVGSPKDFCHNCNKTITSLRTRNATRLWEQMEQLKEAKCPLLSTHIRQPRRGRKSSKLSKSPPPKAAICAIARNETAYLDEWFTYHRAVAGFSEIYLFDNSRPDGMELTNSGRYDNCPGIFIVPWPMAEEPQMEAYDTCVYMIRERNKKQQQLLGATTAEQAVAWTAFIDIDEFIVLKNERETIVDVLRDVVPLPPPLNRLKYKRPAPAALSMNWVMFGTANQTKYRDEPVTKRFQFKVNGYGDNHVKQILLLDSIRYAGNPHFAFLKQLLSHEFYTVMSNGTKVANEFPWIDPAARNRVVVHHYTIKSVQEYQFKGCHRGRADLHTSHEAHKTHCNKVGFVGNIHDDTAWKALIKWVPEYGELYNN